MTVTITGPLFDEAGRPLPFAKYTIVAIDEIIGQDTGGRVERGYTNQTDVNGILTAEIMPGRYALIVHPTQTPDTTQTYQRRDSMVVLDVASMTLQEALNSDVGEITPSVLQQIIAIEQAIYATVAGMEIGANGYIFDTRSQASIAIAKGSLANGATFWMAGLPYRLDNTVVLANSCTADLGEAGIVPASDEWHLEHWGDTTTTIGATGAWRAIAANLRPNIDVIIDGDYTINRAAEVVMKHGWRMLGPGTIKVADGMPTGETYSALHLMYSDRWHLSDIIFDGNRGNRTPVEDSGHTVLVSSCNDWSMTRITSKDATTDGFLVRNLVASNAATIPKNWTMTDCNGLNCFRQGLSVIASRNAQIIGGEFSGTNGTDPQSGIDFESDAGDVNYAIRNITVIGTKFANNAGYGVLTASVHYPQNVRIVCCDFEDNGKGHLNFWALGGAVVDCSFRGIGANFSRAAIDVPTGLPGEPAKIDIIRPRFYEVANTTAAKPLVYVHGSSNARVTLDGPKIEGLCPYIAAMWAPYGVVKNVKDIGGSQNGAILLNGSNCELDTFVVSGQSGAFAFVGGPLCTVKNGFILYPAQNSEGGIVRFTSTASGGTVSNITGFDDVSSGLYGITVDCQMARIEDINLIGWTPARAVHRLGAALTDSNVYTRNIKGNGQYARGDSIPVVTVAELAALVGTPGAQVFARDARNSGEAAGSGTGATLNYKIGLGWRHISTGGVPVA